MAGKAKNAPEAHFPRGNGRGGGNSEVRDMTLPSLRNLGAKVSERSFLHFLPISRKSVAVIFRHQFKNV